MKTACDFFGHQCLPECRHHRVVLCCELPKVLLQVYPFHELWAFQKILEVLKMEAEKGRDIQYRGELDEKALLASTMVP